MKIGDIILDKENPSDYLIIIDIKGDDVTVRDMSMGANHTVKREAIKMGIVLGHFKLEEK